MFNFCYFLDNQRALLVDWLNGTFPHLNLPAKASDDDLRACLQDGTILCMILKRLKFVSAKEVTKSSCFLPFFSSLSY